jgi:hypothetical protein
VRRGSRRVWQGMLSTSFGPTSRTSFTNAE